MMNIKTKRRLDFPAPSPHFPSSSLQSRWTRQAVMLSGTERQREEEHQGPFVEKRASEHKQNAEGI